jgi:hypothetical protein
MVTFAGAIAQVRPTDKLKPLREVTVILEVVELPAWVVTEAGDEVRLKSFTVKR